MKVPYLALADDFAEVADRVMRRFEGVLERQQFVLGPETAALEAAIAEYSGAHHAVACSSGSDALYLAMLALGIGAGDAVIVPALTFFASAGAVARAGARPIFADVDPAALTMEREQLEQSLKENFERREGGYFCRRSGARLAAVVAVHLYGRPVDVAGLRRALAPVKVAIIEDAAQAIAAGRPGAMVGALGDLGCFSFYPTKNLGGAGDGGAVTTGDGEIARRLRRLRVHGADDGADEYFDCGINARLGELQAAFLNAKLERLDAWTERRRRLASAYRAGLAALEQRGALWLPEAVAGHVYHQFTVRVPGGSLGLRRQLEADGVATRVFYPVPLHLQPCFGDLGQGRGSLPESERAVGEILSLPIFPALSEQQQQFVCDRLSAALGGGA